MMFVVHPHRSESGDAAVRNHLHEQSRWRVGARQNPWSVTRFDPDVVRLCHLTEGGVEVSSLDLRDPFSGSHLDITPLHEDTHVMVSFAAGQDGSQDVCVSFDGQNLTVCGTLSQDFTCVQQCGGRILAANFYEQEMAWIKLLNKLRKNLE